MKNDSDWFNRVFGFIEGEPLFPDRRHTVNIIHDDQIYQGNDTQKFTLGEIVEVIQSNAVLNYHLDLPHNTWDLDLAGKRLLIHMHADELTIEEFCAFQKTILAAIGESASAHRQRWAIWSMDFRSNTWGIECGVDPTLVIDEPVWKHVI